MYAAFLIDLTKRILFTAVTGLGQHFFDIVGCRGSDSKTRLFKDFRCSTQHLLKRTTVCLDQFVSLRKFS